MGYELRAFYVSHEKKKWQKKKNTRAHAIVIETRLINYLNRLRILAVSLMLPENLKVSIIKRENNVLYGKSRIIPRHVSTSTRTSERNNIM